MLSADVGPHDDPFDISALVALEAIYRIVEGLPVETHNAAKKIYDTSMTKAQAEDERLKVSGTLDDRAQAM
jgi:hypothetical protein